MTSGIKDAAQNGKAKSAPGSVRTEKLQPRHLSRIGAVQALYQMDLAGADAGDVVAQFSKLRFAAADGAPQNDGPEETLDLSGGDVDFFSDVVFGVVSHQRTIDPLVDQQLAEGWRLVRVDSILRAILRAGAFELLQRKDVPERVVINEYINVGHAFFFDDETRVINGVLDALALKIRGSA